MATLDLKCEMLSWFDTFPVSVRKALCRKRHEVDGVIALTTNMAAHPVLNPNDPGARDTEWINSAEIPVIEQFQNYPNLRGIT
jgi:hypothetical protein